MTGPARSDLALMTYGAQDSRGDERRHPALLEVLAGGSEQDWLECAQALTLRKDRRATACVLAGALVAHPQSPQIRLALAGAILENGDAAGAESHLRRLLADDPGHAAGAFLLARMLKGQGRTSAASAVLGALFQCKRHDVETVIQAVELLDECGHQQAAVALCESEFAAGCRDARLHAYAGMLLSQLGQFTLARERHLFALSHATQAPEWHVPLGLADLQRYATSGHPDVAMFRDILERADLSDAARATILFALGKAHDDVGDYESASGYLRQANATVHAGIRWSRKLWRRSVDLRLSRRAPVEVAPVPINWTPIFIVGVPRSGTTLVAELLARHPDVCHRGELPWMPSLAEQFANGGRADHEWLAHAGTHYAQQLRQDDSDARWFIDKQPQNFMHVDLILALFPHARIVHCQRNTRDNALSLWMQSFQPGAQDFAYDFSDIGAVIQGSRRLMAHWMKRYPAAIRAVRYEELTEDPAAALQPLSTWLGLSTHDRLGASNATAAISTASLWQVRQPVHTRSVGRWRHYEPYLPQLLRLPEN
jgi:tetratricopeptide (TPR) repeat protein